MEVIVVNWMLLLLLLLLLGICVSNPLRLVMEIASLGPLNIFLRINQ